MVYNPNEAAGSISQNEGALTYPVNVTRLPAKGLSINLQPDQETLGKLAEQCDVLTIADFIAQLNVKSWHKDGVRVSGSLSASLEQACIITLEPVQEQIDAQIDALFVPHTSKLAKPKINNETGELVIEAEGDDVPELFEPPNLDIGAVATEFFALELNPYPKSPNIDDANATLAEHGAKSEHDAAENPFAALSKIRDKL